MQQTQIPHPASPMLLFALCATFALFGLVDHDLWRYEDAVHLGVAWDMAQNDHWLTPQLAGESWPGAPLYYWLAAALGKCFGPWLEFHNGARLATACFMFLLLLAAGCAASVRQGARPSAPRKFEWSAPLLLIGAPGLLIPAHEAQPVIAILAGHALCYHGLTLLPEKRRGGILLAIGLLISILAGGLNGLLPLFLLPLLLIFPAWRSNSSLIGGATAIVIVTAVWFTLGYFQPALIPGLDLAQAHLPSLAHFELLAWFAWPLWPLAFWSVWSHRRQLAAPQILLPLVGSAGSLIYLLVYAEPRNLSALPVLLPLALLAAPGIARLRRGASSALDWFGMLSFTLTAALVWVATIALHFGVPAKTHSKAMRYAEGLTIEILWLPMVTAIVLSLLWLLTIYLSRRSPWRSITHWAAGVTLTWTLAALLLMPLVNNSKSYRHVAEKIAAHTSHGENSCVWAQGLSDAYRAALYYHGDIVTRNSDKSCAWLLVLSNSRRPLATAPESGWHKVLEANRPGEKSERFYLYKR